MRIVTLNSWKGDGAYSQRLAAMANQLELLQPDVLCVQEALRSTEGRLDTAGYLARSLNLQMIYAPSRQKIRNVDGHRIDCHSGLAVLTAFSICGFSSTVLPLEDAEDERISLTLEMDTPIGSLVVTNVHLSHLEESEDLRRNQLVAAIEHGQPLNYSATWLCCGDFNWTLAEEDLRQVEKSTGWLPFDCYAAGGGKLPGLTLPGGDSPRPGKRIDYILGLVREEADIFCCAKSQIVLDHPDSAGCYPSDHFGVMVEIMGRTHR